MNEIEPSSRLMSYAEFVAIDSRRLAEVPGIEASDAHEHEYKPSEPEDESLPRMSFESWEKSREELRELDRLMVSLDAPIPEEVRSLERSTAPAASPESSMVSLEKPKDATDMPSPVSVLETPALAEVVPDDEHALGGKASGYKDFPIAHVRDVQEFDDPLRAMNDLCRELLVHQDYGRVRTQYCHLAIRLNLIGKLAPRYRPHLRAGAWGNVIHKVVHRDQLMIDLHWCHATKMPLMPIDPGHAALFGDNADFHFDLAWMLAGKKWKSGYRAVEVLCLTTPQQCQMQTLHGPEFAERLKSLTVGWWASKGKSVSKIAMVKLAFSQWSERDKRVLPQRDSYEKLWLARELLGPGATHQQIAELHALMMGSEVKDRTTIRGKLKSLDAQVALV